MASWGNLPTELPRDVGGYLSEQDYARRGYRGQQDLARLCSVNRAFNRVFVDFLYSRYCNGDKSSAMLFLRTICRNPKLAEKVKEVVIDRQLPIYEQFQRVTPANLLQEEKDEIVRLAIGFLADPGMVKDGSFFEKLKNGEEGPALKLLLLLLPNFRSLRMLGKADYFVANYIIGPSVLSQVEAFEFGSTWLAGPRVRDYQQVVLLPSLRKLKVTRLKLADEGRYRFQVADSPGPNISSISFRDCAIAKGVLRAFLHGRCRGLEVFEYTFSNAHGGGHGSSSPPPCWDHAHIRELLTGHSATLQRLVLLTDGISDEPQTRIGDLREFTELKQLTIDMENLVSRDQMEKACDLLPQSLEYLFIRGVGRVSFEEFSALKNACEARFATVRIGCFVSDTVQPGNIHCFS